MNPTLARHYRYFRQHQRETYGDSGLCVDGRSARQFTGGGAAYGFHAVAAVASARNFINFRDRLISRRRK